jgi:hypothetical protein
VKVDLSLLPAVALSLSGACSNSQPDSAATAGAGAMDVAGGSAGAAGPNSFGALYAEVFTTCAIPICHGGGRAGLDMSSREAAYASLVDRPADAAGPCAMLGKRRVVAFAPEDSLLLLKLDIRPPCGQQMPVGGQLPEAERERVRQWIALGARDD